MWLSKEVTRVNKMMKRLAILLAAVMALGAMALADNYDVSEELPTEVQQEQTEVASDEHGEENGDVMLGEEDDELFGPEQDDESLEDDVTAEPTDELVDETQEPDSEVETSAPEAADPTAIPESETETPAQDVNTQEITPEPVVTPEPVEATDEPADETEAPVEATDEPVEATEEPVEETEVPAEATEEPVEETEAPAEETEEPVEETEAPAEETEAPDEMPELPEASPVPETQEPDAEESTELPVETEEPVTAVRVRIRMQNQDQLYFGDQVTLQAVIEGAQTDDVIIWAYYDEEASLEQGEDVWVPCAKGEKYVFVLDEHNAFLTYRVAVGETVSKSYTLPEVLARPEIEEPAEEPTEEPTEEPMEETVEEPTEESDEGAVEEPAEEPAEEAAEEPAEEPAQLVDDSAQKVGSIADELNSDRSIDIYADWGGDVLCFGDESTLIAVLNGYDNAVYSVQWQSSENGADWVDVDGATDTRYTMIVTEDNYLHYWRVVVTVTDVIDSAAEE